MKWILITTTPRTAGTLGSNVGDEFARFGTMRLIREIDPDAEFDLLDKERPSQWTEVRPHDKVVLCGMPLFWSIPSINEHPRNLCSEIHWWEPMMRGWASSARENFLVFGVGHVHADRIDSLLEYAAAMTEVLHRAYAITLREPIIDHPQMIDTVCPSAFTLFDSPARKTRRLCNLMIDGGHFGYLRPAVTAEWEQRMQAVSDWLQANGFEIIAHTHRERDLAYRLGWPSVHIFNSAQEYLDLYAQASCYVGNRMHGAAVVASMGVPTWAFTHDSRLGMVRRLGGHATGVEAVTVASLDAWLHSLPGSGRVGTPFNVAEEYVRMKDLLKRFMEA